MAHALSTDVLPVPLLRVFHNWRDQKRREVRRAPSDRLFELGDRRVNRQRAVGEPFAASGGSEKRAITPPIYRLNEGRISGGWTRCRGS